MRARNRTQMNDRRTDGEEKGTDISSATWGFRYES